MSGENCDHIWRCWDLRCHMGFKTTSKLQCGELGHLCMQEALPSAWTLWGKGALCLWGCKIGELKMLMPLTGLSVCHFCPFCTGEFDMSARQTFQHDARAHLHWLAKDHLGLCLLPTTPLFFQMDKRRTEKFMFCSQHRRTDHPRIWSLATFWSDRKEQEGSCACLLQHKFWSSPHWSFGAWGAGITTRARTSKLFLFQTHHLIQNN